MSHILVVDDDDEVRDLLRMALEEEGHTVDKAESGRVALEKLRATSERLVVILDYLMPGMDGLEVLHTIAQDETLASRHSYILMSAGRFFPANDEALRGLRVAVLPKPFDLDKVFQKVRQVAGALESGGQA
jgi:CheY-like chemotaxis protein